MTGLLKGARFRAAIGLIAAYAIALQTLFAAFAPLPAHAQAADIAGWHVLCFGSGNAVPTDGDPAAPAPASGKFHCVLCGSALAAAAVLPEPVVESYKPKKESKSEVHWRARVMAKMAMEDELKYAGRK